MSDYSRLKNGILGFIIGDAMGVPLEFTKRRTEKVVDMLEYGTHHMPKGSWSDDSSMVVATIKSIIDNKGNINYEDIMNNYILWVEKGKFTSNNKTFGIGRTTLRALRNYYYREEFEIYKNPLMCGIDDIKDNGNGSLMRILPITYYCYYKKLTEEEIYKLVKDISSMTHKHSISILGCYIYVLFVIGILNGKEKKDIYKSIREYNYNKYFDKETINAYSKVLDNDISLLDIDNINSSGYVVNTLEAVIWCFMNSNNYNESIIEAINLGDDVDTIGALVGGISGSYYNEINNKWLKDIKRKDYLLDLCNKYYEVLKFKKKIKIHQHF